MKTANPRQWYRSLKRIVGYNVRDDKPSVEDIKHLSDAEQAEVIAESFSKVSHEYEPLDRSKIVLEEVKEGDWLVVTADEVLETLNALNANKSVPKNDIPTKILKRFANQTTWSLESWTESWPVTRTSHWTAVSPMGSPMLMEIQYRAATLLGVTCEHRHH